MSDQTFFDDGLMALPGPGAASPAPAHSEPQDAVPADPELDLMALLAPVQAAPGLSPQEAPEASQDDFAVAQAPSVPARPPMYDAEGRKLGPRGVLVALRARLLRALDARDEAQAQTLRRAVGVAERTWQEWCERTGYSPEEAARRDELSGVAAGLRRHQPRGEKA